MVLHRVGPVLYKGNAISIIGIMKIFIVPTLAGCVDQFNRGRFAVDNERLIVAVL